MRIGQKKQLAYHLQDSYKVSIRRSCDVLMIYHSAYWYRSRRREDKPLRNRIREIAETRVRYGHWRIHTLLRREGWKDNHKRTYRVYKEEVHAPMKLTTSRRFKLTRARRSKLTTPRRSKLTT